MLSNYINTYLTASIGDNSMMIKVISNINGNYDCAQFISFRVKDNHFNYKLIMSKIFQKFNVWEINDIKNLNYQNNLNKEQLYNPRFKIDILNKFIFNGSLFEIDDNRLSIGYKDSIKDTSEEELDSIETFCTGLRDLWKDENIVEMNLIFINYIENGSEVYVHKNANINEIKKYMLKCTWLNSLENSNFDCFNTNYVINLKK